MKMKREWCEFLPEEKYSDEISALRLKKLYQLLLSKKLEVKVIPNEVYGLMHGKAGVITYKDGSKTSFLGSINETKNAYTVNYEMLWEDDSIEAVDWVQDEFDYFWNNRYAIIRRTRDFLEKTINKETGEYYLQKIDVELFGESDNEALELMGYLYQAYSTAEEFCRLLSSRVKGGGFMSTLMLRRIGSTMFAGENTAKKMLAWTKEGKEMLKDLYDDVFEEDDEISEENRSEIKDLTSDEISCLEKLVKVLKNNKDTDPKYIKTLSILQNGVRDEGPWKDKGCIIFSQYYHSAKYVAELLSGDIKDMKIGLYAGGDRSGIFDKGRVISEKKENIIKGIIDHEIKILVGTDAASEGLNLQTLSTLINLDLPWNPTRLEQRKGRIQRIGQISNKY